MTLLPHQIQLSNISTLIPLMQSTRDFLERNEELRGNIYIKANCEFYLNSGDMKMEWEISAYSPEHIKVKGQHLNQCIDELVRRITKDKQMAPLCLPRVPDQFQLFELIEAERPE